MHRNNKETEILMDKIKNYEVIQQLKSFGDCLNLWLAEDNSGSEYEILTIKVSNENERSIERVLRNEIAPLIGREIEGVQKIIELNYDKENGIKYIVYENVQDEFEDISKFNKGLLLSLLSTLNNLKKENRFGFIISPETVLYNNSNHIKLKFIGLFEIFSLFNQLPEVYISPELLENKKPRIQDDIFSVGKLFIEFLSTKINLEKVLAEDKSNRFKKYSEFIEIIEGIKEPQEVQSNRDSISVVTQPEYEDEIAPVLKEMNEWCYMTIDTNRSKKGNQVTGKFTTKTFSGRYFVDNQNYIFIPYSEKLKGSDESVRRNGSEADFNFVDYPVSNFNCTDAFNALFEERNKLASLNSGKHDKIKKWRTLPEKEKEFIEEKAFKAKYIERYESKNNNQNIIFKLKDEFKDWENLKDIKSQNVGLTIDESLIGTVLDYNPNDNKLVIRDSKLSIDEIPEKGELTQDVYQETSQFKKQKEACDSFESRDIVNPTIAGILATPESMPNFNRVDIDYHAFDEKIFNNHLKNDDSQKQAVLEALNKRPVYLIQGPPGTGKTTVIVELVRQLIKENSNYKILITSQSNLAVDNVLERLPNEILFMRLASDFAIDRDNISSNIEPHLFEQKLKNWVEASIDKSNHYLQERFESASNNKSLIDFWSFYTTIPQKNEKELINTFHQRLRFSHNYLKRLFENVKSKKEIEKIFDKELGSDFKKLKKIQREWFAFISNASTEEGDRKKSMLNNGSEEIDLQTAYAMSVNVIGSTCIHIASGAYSNIDFKFDYVIMDEASKASPSETLVPINMARNIVLIGDHKQLPPVVTREEAVKTKIKEQLDDNGLDFEKEFGESLFESLIESFESNNSLVVYKKMLDIQYRMPRQLGALISRHFYDGNLKNPDLSIDGLKNYDDDKFHGIKLKKPLVEIHDDYTNTSVNVPNSIVFVTSSNEEDPYDNDDKFERKNYCNVGIIKDTLHEINKLFNGNMKSDKPINIGIIAGYRGQVNLLIDQIKLKEYKNFLERQGNKTHSLIEINTVDKFQGAERDIIIYDIVRSTKGRSNIGFLDDYRRINVAFSRAKKMLVIVGDSRYIIKRAMLNPKSKFEAFKLQEIVRELEDNGLVYTSFKSAVDEN